MSAQVVSIFSHKKFRPTTDESLARWQTAFLCGDDDAAGRARADYYRALYSDWPTAPCDTEQP